MTEAISKELLATQELMKTEPDYDRHVSMMKRVILEMNRDTGLPIFDLGCDLIERAAKHGADRSAGWICSALVELMAPQTSQEIH